MSYAGEALRIVLLPFKLVTVPLQWLFKHRCKFKDGSTACTGLFCPVGKKGVPGWSNHYRAGEWVYRKPIPELRPTAPAGPPKLGMGRYYSESIWEEVIVNGVPRIMKNGMLVIQGNKELQQIQLGHHGTISIQGGGTVSISVNGSGGDDSNIRIEGDGEVFMLSRKRGS